MERCWARSLGGCSSKLSAEHLITESFFAGKTLTVYGYPWCREKPNVIGKGSLTANILCSSHNSQLSEVDTGGTAAFKILREIRRVENVRAAGKRRRWRLLKHTVDGPLLERWFLKTVINMKVAHGTHLKWGGAGTPSEEPPRSLVEIVFGVAELRPPMGLWWIAAVGDAIQPSESVSHAPLIKDNSFVFGGLFEFRGFRFLLSLMPRRPPTKLGSLLPGHDWAAGKVDYHLERIRIKLGKHVSQVLDFKW